MAEVTASPTPLDAKKQSPQHTLEVLSEHLGPLLPHLNKTNASNKPDSLQLLLFELVQNASDTCILNFVGSKQVELYRFVISLFICTLHKSNPIRMGSKVSEQKKNTNI